MSNAQCCRFCGNELQHSFCDLGMSPLSNAYLTSEQLQEKEYFYPLHAYVCMHCYLVQLPEFETPEKIFSDYAYFSSYSETWLKHAQQYVQLMCELFFLNCSSQVIEIASNDGYLLQYFKQKNIPVLGIEPAANVANVAEQKGIVTLVKFFGTETANLLREQGKCADLLLGNNVLAHVPDINDFVAGMQIILKPDGVITVEFPHLLRLIEQNQFDTIYHEHFSYLSLFTVEKIFAKQGLTVFDVQELSTHGGSLRIYAKHITCSKWIVHSRVAELKKAEFLAGLTHVEAYSQFSEKVREIKRQVLQFLIEAKHDGKTVVGYGAPAKGNTLLNYCGIRSDFIDYTVDRSPYKQQHFLPGTHIPIYDPEKIKTTQPDYVFILPWNLREEIMQQIAYIRDWGGQFVVAIPELKIL